MTDNQPQFIETNRLRIGMFVHLDLSWTEHPFPLNKFKIKSEDQIATIRSLGLERVRYYPEKSDQHADEVADNGVAAAAETTIPSAPEETPEQLATQQRKALLSAQQASLQACERQFAKASQVYQKLMLNARNQPIPSREAAEQLVGAIVDEVAGEQEMAIRLLSEKAGEESSLHALNVTVLSILLGKSHGLPTTALRDIGLGALLHDIGKMDLPAKVRWRDDHASAAEQKLFQTHVAKGVEIGQRMQLDKEVLAVIGDHHELVDGSGYPRGLKGDAMTLPARIVAIVNQYDNLCNPTNPAQAMTPHDTLAVMFAKMKRQLDAECFAQFIRLMGVYPPGSVVQLSDERYALVVSVNAARPLKPRVVIHDPQVPANEALVINLEETPQLNVHRSLKPVQLPRAVFDYLSPRKRMCYFFERSRDSVEGGD